VDQIAGSPSVRSRTDQRLISDSEADSFASFTMKVESADPLKPVLTPNTKWLKGHF